MPPNFDVLDERAAAELLRAAQDLIIEEALDDADGPLGSAHAVLVERIDEAEFENIFAEVVRKRTKISEFLQSAGGVDKAILKVRQQLGLTADETVTSITSDACSDTALDYDLLRRATDILGQGSKREQSLAELFRDALAVHDPQDFFPVYMSAFLKKTDKTPKSDAYLITKKTAQVYPEIAAFLFDERERVVEVCNKCRAAAVAEASQALFVLAQRFLDVYEEFKKERAVLDYDDLIVKTRNLLHRSAAAAWVLYKLDGGLDHILVDEAQDTSPDQWRVIEALAGEFFAGEGARLESASDLTRTIFAVGDEKQSIYSFQGADPDKFHEMEGLFHYRVEGAKHTWASVPLNLSFRSTTEVLNVVDAILKTKS